ncbi:sugar O-acetyltransferase [Cellulophaga omnivescoria]|uniref:sugar O-acetyltransferase n=1 Tax=Cellulophaga omnivescoria TaxID=1888890 RepID=UPI0009878EC9|nr:sugar O-acetyltransferase [Cellulophaga omnivescoria]WKB80363.1 sugar O-acetyltransferase [Cellulophaga lytica]
MQSEKDKMLSGKPYSPYNKQLAAERLKAKDIVFNFNSRRPSQLKEQKQDLVLLLGKTPKRFYIEPPFRCDYGYNIELGANFFANYNLTILDCAKVAIGDNVMLGPNVAIYTATHPIHHTIRNKHYEHALPITIGNNVWVGGNVVINPGVTIGDNSVIGSGSVVTKNIPSNVIAVGNPCVVKRQITEEDKVYFDIK